MAVELDQDPLVFDASTILVPCPRIHAVKFDSTGGGTAAIVDATTSHRIWSTDETCFDVLDISFPVPKLLHIVISSGILYIYLGSGPR